ncbi:hypothetical protein [Fodinibius salsisoli]|uniref:DUF2281 domain-containing protein n=1 Tax=Fodinibius salsisoli TaxID=2820877 RepID=A0ABT3PTD1_9BACT|nr:hypothetical protein [Fodinibius salsisoli]MCW9709116.1 hypothetical protein [Fodinibius salsisoli]
MKRDQVLKNTIEKLHQLDDVELKEAKDFVDFLLSKVAERGLVDEIQQQAEKGKSFDFLHDEEELYTLEDLKGDEEL